MALIDVSELLTDPDFCDELVRVRRIVAVNEYGRAAITETSDTIVGSVQPGAADALERGEDMSRPVDWRVVYTLSELVEQQQVDGGYADAIVWQGKRYQVKSCDHFNNYGLGYYKALCLSEGTTASASQLPAVTVNGDFVISQGN